MKTINTYILEKLHLDKNIKVNEKLSIVEWFDYFKENGLEVSQDRDMNYYVHFPTRLNPLFRFKSEKLLGKYRCWEAVSGTLKDIPLIEVKEGYEELMNAEDLDKTDSRITQYTFSINNAEIIINTLNYYK